jgi:hypothetical protein
MKAKQIISGLCLLLIAGCSTEFEIASTDVPLAVIDAFKQKYPSAQTEEWEVEKHKNEPMVFEVEFKLDGKSKEAEFKPDGTFVKEE